MFTLEQKKQIRQHYQAAMDRITTTNIGCFQGHEKPLFLISDEYPGIWLEHAYDSVFFARLEPAYTEIAKNVLSLFMERQKENGQLPCYIIDRNKNTTMSECGYTQIQECVSFFRLCFEYYTMSQDKEFLKTAFQKGEKWISWLQTYRMPRQTGLVESFCGFDDGHDHSPRKKGMTYDTTAKNRDAALLPEDDAVLPMIEPDVNAVYYGDLCALAQMAEELGQKNTPYARQAKEVKEALFSICYDPEDCFFYDVDKNGAMRKLRSIAITNVISEGVLEQEQVDMIYKKHLKNPKEFFTPYPFPSLSVSDPYFIQNRDGNSWGFYSQALTILRCTRWMDAYHKEQDFDFILEKWVDKWTFGNKIMFGQELNPFTGEASACSEWYSSCMLVYIYAVRRLGLTKTD